MEGDREKVKWRSTKEGLIPFNKIDSSIHEEMKRVDVVEVEEEESETEYEQYDEDDDDDEEDTTEEASNEEEDSEPTEEEEVESSIREQYPWEGEDEESSDSSGSSGLNTTLMEEEGIFIEKHTSEAILFNSEKKNYLTSLVVEDWVKYEGEIQKVIRVQKILDTMKFIDLEKSGVVEGKDLKEVEREIEVNLCLQRTDGTSL